MENGQKAINDLFQSRRIFNIPKYQRAYAWGEKQLKDFMDDLKNQSIDRKYFFGTLLLQIQNSEGNFKIIDVVDGQQRITTLVIFMSVVIQKLIQEGDNVEILRETYLEYKDEYRLRVLDYDNQFFIDHIMKESVGDVETKTPSQRRMVEAKKYFKDEVDKMAVEEVRACYEKIERSQVLTYTVSNNSEATLIFETTNDRGKSLTSLEKMKSFMMYKIYITSEEPELHLKLIQDNFGEMYKSYDALRQKWFLGEDDILRYNFILYSGKESVEGRQDYYKHLGIIKEKINQTSNLDDGALETAKFIAEYSDMLRDTFSTFESMTTRIFHGNLWNIFIMKRVSNFVPLLVVALKYDNSKEKADFERITNLLEIMSFRVYGVRKRKESNAKLQKRLHELAQNFNGNYDKLTREIKHLIGEYCSNHEFKARLHSSNLYEDMSSRDLTYLLWSYENHLRSHEGSGENFLQFRTYKNLSIEHIIPQSPRFVREWMTSDFQGTHLHSIGNLTLDLSYENSAKSNFSFAEKNRFFYRLSRFLCQKELVDFACPDSQDWNGDSILSRQSKVVDFALNRWDYENV